jgi:hypothetical protein
MSKRIDKSWLVFVSIENPEHDRCVDFFSRPEGRYGFEEFRRDVEDGGQWTPVNIIQASAMLRGPRCWTPLNAVCHGWPIF